MARPLFPIRVSVVLEGSDAPIVSGVDIYALKRFSKEAGEQFPSPILTTRTQEQRNAILVLHVYGKLPPCPDAFKFVASWMDRYKKAGKPVPILAGSLNYALIPMVNVYAAAVSFGIKFTLDILHEAICDHIRAQGPITANELMCVWKLVPFDSDIMFTAVSSIVYFYWKGAIAEEENAAIEGHFEEDPGLNTLFAAEERRLLKKKQKTTIVARKKARAQTETHGYTGGGSSIDVAAEDSNQSNVVFKSMEGQTAGLTTTKSRKQENQALRSTRAAGAPAATAAAAGGTQ